MAERIGSPGYPSWVPEHGSASSSGKTLRDEFAMAALIGLCANPIPGSHHLPHNRAEEAYFQADEMIKARSQTAKGGE